MFNQFCPRCGVETDHRERILPKIQHHEESPSGVLKAFLSGLFSGSSMSGIAAMDQVDRYLVCTRCGARYPGQSGRGVSIGKVSSAIINSSTPRG
ncbi:hypothetical protein [Aeromonas enteropelogenes]|uniref:hypothetical protein n=1 Tax=Aeromonas enteropelogenes TaxID=29489 RepID=UPI003BA1FC31